MPQHWREEGRRVFGSDPASYELGRPGHPPRVYEVLAERCALAPTTKVLEVGPGTGQATRRLLELGAHPLVALEPDPVLAAYLHEKLGGQIEIRQTTLEDADLTPETFDLAAAASSFHWVDEEIGLRRIFAALRPGGRVAIWWTIFGDPEAPDAFVTATSPLLVDLDTRPSSGSHALDRQARTTALRAAGFDSADHELVRWTVSWDVVGIRALYGTFPNIARLAEPRRGEILDALARIARDDFGGRVERTLLTPLYTALRPDR